HLRANVADEASERRGLAVELALEESEVHLDGGERLTGVVVQLARDAAHHLLDLREPALGEALQVGAMLQHEGVEAGVADRHRGAIAERPVSSAISSTATSPSPRVVARPCTSSVGAPRQKSHRRSSPRASSRLSP